MHTRRYKTFEDFHGELPTFRDLVTDELRAMHEAELEPGTILGCGVG